MTIDKLIHYLTLASSALAAALAFDHAVMTDAIGKEGLHAERAIATGLSAAIAAIGAVVTVLRSRKGKSE